MCLCASYLHFFKETYYYYAVFVLATEEKASLEISFTQQGILVLYCYWPYILLFLVDTENSVINMGAFYTFARCVSAIRFS